MWSNEGGIPGFSFAVFLPRFGMDEAMVCALELGGTKTVAAVGTANGVVRDEVRFPTTSPGETLGRAVAWWQERGVARTDGVIGVGSFGPIRVRRDAEDYGVMLATPKPGWQGFPVAGFLQEAMQGMEVRVETDVNAAAGCADMAYITVGTGIGAGILTGGRLVHGAVHPEFGHLRVPRHPDDGFAGCCPYHGDCLEGLACGPAIHARWGREGKDLPGDHPVWEMEAWYLAHGILALCAVTCPEVVVLGGGVPQAEGLHERVTQCLLRLSHGYYEAAEKPGFVVKPKLGQQAGIAGALMLAGVGR
jgi:fructokinase